MNEPTERMSLQRAFKAFGSIFGGINVKVGELGRGRGTIQLGGRLQFLFFGKKGIEWNEWLVCWAGGREEGVQKKIIRTKDRVFERSVFPVKNKKDRVVIGVAVFQER